MNKWFKTVLFVVITVAAYGPIIADVMSEEAIAQDSGMTVIPKFGKEESI